MTDQLRAAAEMALEALQKVTQAFLDTEGSHGQMENEAWDSAYEAASALRQALAKPISMTASELADRIKRGEKWKIAEPDTGIDRGAWSDVPDATKWVDDLRGEDEPPTDSQIIAGAIFDFAGFLTTRDKVIKVGASANASPVADLVKEWANMRELSLDDAAVMWWSDVLEEPPNSTADVVGPEPVAWLWKNKDGHQVITDDPDYADGTWVPLYTAPPKPDLLNQTCCECWGKATKREWQGLTDEELKPLCDEWRIMYGAYVNVFARAIEAKLREKNSGRPIKNNDICDND